MSKDGVALNELTPYSFDQERSLEHLARMIILQEMQFVMVEHPAFWIFIGNLRPEFHIVSRTHWHLIVLKYMKGKKEN